MRSRAVLLAAPDLALEPALVAAAARAGIPIGRRCLDAADLLAAASLDPESPVVLSPGLPRLSADVVSRLGGRELAGLAQDAADQRRLRELGIDLVLDLAAGPDAVMARLAELAGDRSEGVWALPDGPRRSGRLIAVWGPQGAPGRTVVAMALAEASAALGRETLLVDADTHGPALAQRLGVLDEASGLLIACRQADHGRLTPATLLGAARSLRPRLSMLTGLPSPTRWRDVRPSSIEELWAVAGSAFETTIADTSSSLEEEGVPSSLGMRRNAVGRSLLHEADVLVIVVRADALGLMRAAQSLTEALALCPSARLALVLNGITRRNRFEAARAAAAIEDMLGAAALDAVVSVHVPWDRQVDRALASGSLLGEGGRSALLRAVRKLAVTLLDTAAGDQRNGDQGEGSTTTVVPILAKS